MAGRMGNDRVTVKKMTIVRSDAARNLLLIKGALPGARNAHGHRQEGQVMPSTTLFSKAGKELGTVDLPETLFAAPVNEAVMHQAVTAQLAGRRTGTHDTKTRGEVRGGGAKPYRQKGTGRARQGSRSAPHYAGGGVVFGPHPRSYEQRLPKRMKRLALQWRVDRQVRRWRGHGRRRPWLRRHPRRASWSAISRRSRPAAESSSWRPVREQNLELIGAQPARRDVLRADSLNIVDVLNADTLLITQPSLTTMAEVYA